MNDKRERSNYILFLLGKFISIFGASIYSFAMGLYVLEITDSGLSFALTLIISIIPMLIINPFAGVLADKFDKKKIVVSMDILNGVFLIFLYIISGIYGLHLIMVYVSIFIATIFTTIFAITMEAAIPNIVSGNMLININSASKIIDSISSMLGPMVGGIVFAFIDIRYFILFSAISYIFSGVSEIFIDFKYNYIEYNTKNNNINFFIDMKEGLKYIRERRSLIGLFSVFISLNFFIGFAVSIPLPYIINNVLVLGSKNLGIIQSFAPVGMMIGALMIKSIIEKKSYKKILTYASSVLSVCIVLLGIPILFRNITVVNTIYTAYYVGIMTVFGATISCIDI
jgi:MFS family permease